MSTYLGRTVVTMPSSPFPVSFEWKQVFQNAHNDNMFTGQQQIIQWNTTGYYTASVQMPPMDATTGRPWQVFLQSCQGIANVFTFPSEMITAYPGWSIQLTTDGTTPRYFCLMNDEAPWKIEVGNIYSTVFEIREAL